MFWSWSNMCAQAIMGFLAAGKRNCSKLKKKLVLNTLYHYSYCSGWSLSLLSITDQGTKLRLIQSPMWLKLSCWRPRFKSQSPSRRPELFEFVYLALMFFATKWSFKVDESARTIRSVKENRHECYEPNMSTSAILDLPNVTLYIVKWNVLFGCADTSLQS